MLGFGTGKITVHKHWYVILLDFETSTSDFYASIETNLKTRALTGLECTRIEYSEGGVLSARRSYLRMRRERLIFDICSAPFGNTWFFSCRYSEIPLSLKLSHVLFLFFAVLIDFWFCIGVFGRILGFLLFVASLIATPFLAQAIAAGGGQDLDATLLRIPVVGGIYELLFRKETYFREDTRLAYIDIVDNTVRKKIDEVTAAKGVKLVDYKDATPPSHTKMVSLVGSLLNIGR